MRELAIVLGTPLLALPGPAVLGMLTASLVDSFRRRREPRTLEVGVYKGCGLLIANVLWLGVFMVGLVWIVNFWVGDEIARQRLSPGLAAFVLLGGALMALLAGSAAFVLYLCSELAGGSRGSRAVKYAMLIGVAPWAAFYGFVWLAF